MKEYNIASIAGDGIGKEVLPEGLKVLKDVALKPVSYTHLTLPTKWIV